jgi:hypothetical protein
MPYYVAAQSSDPGRGAGGIPRQSRSKSSLLPVLVFFLLAKHSHETDHAAPEVRKDSTYHEKGARSGKLHYFNTILRLLSRIESPVYSVRGVIDQETSYKPGDIDVIGPNSIVINLNVVKPGNDKVDHSTCLDRDSVRYQLMPICRGRRGAEPVQRRVRLPLAKADAGIGQPAMYGLVFMLSGQYGSNATGSSQLECVPSACFCHSSSASLRTSSKRRSVEYTPVRRGCTGIQCFLTFVTGSAER